MMKFVCYSNMSYFHFLIKRLCFLLFLILYVKVVRSSYEEISAKCILPISYNFNPFLLQTMAESLGSISVGVHF